MSEDWSDEELTASVIAYREMQALERAGEKRFKKQIYRNLAERFGRTDKAFEFRMQNISAVLALIGRAWLAGLKPAAHVGANVAAKLERLINDLEGFRSPPRAAFELEVREQRKHRADAPSCGSARPAKTTTSVTVFTRDPAVKAWVLDRAKGACECCDELAPFVTPDGTPFHEVHHLRALAEGGSDRVTNAVALCPSCHRRLHYRNDSGARRGNLASKVTELQPERRLGWILR